MQRCCVLICILFWFYVVCASCYYFYFLHFLRDLALTLVRFLQYLNGAQLLFILNPLTFFVKQVFLLKRRGSLNRFPSFLLQVWVLATAAQQLRAVDVRRMDLWRRWVRCFIIYSVHSI